MAALAVGKLSHAAFAFERVLQINPRNHRARLELARTYTAMERYTQAEQEFRYVLDAGPPERVQRNIETYLAWIHRRTRKWSGGGQLGLGVFYDDNVNFGPSSRLVDTLLEAGIQPWVTLYHWDLPYALYLRGGWLNPDLPGYFAEYTRVVVERLGDRVRHWMTVNEPQVFIGMGLYDGVHAPGWKLDFAEVLLAAHHTLLAHGRAVQTLRAYSPQPCLVGAAPVGVTFIPASEAPEAAVEGAPKRPRRRRSPREVMDALGSEADGSPE